MSYPRGSAVIPSKRAKFETLDPLQLSSPFRRLDEAALSLERDRHKKNAASEGAFSSHDTVSSRNGALLETKNGLAESCEVESLPSDTLAAVWLLRGQFPRGLPKVTPFALRSQLYAVVDDKTRVDRELDVLRRANRIRMFRIPTSVEDAAVQLTDDYVAAVLRYADDAPPSRHAHLPALRWFCDYVLPNCTSDIIAHEELLKLMKEGIEREVKREMASLGSTLREVDKVADEHISVLLQACCLVRHTSGLSLAVSGMSGERQGYLFSMPHAGPAFRAATAGRKELVKMLSRKKAPEMLESQLMKRKLKTSPLGMRWHLRELLGDGTVVRIQAPAGATVRLFKRGQ